MIIPPEKLTLEVIRGIVEAFITREGTDYGEREFSLQDKVRHLMPQVLRGEVLIVYDDATESVNLVPKEDAAQSA